MFCENHTGRTGPDETCSGVRTDTTVHIAWERDPLDHLLEEYKCTEGTDSPVRFRTPHNDGVDPTPLRGFRFLDGADFSENICSLHPRFRDGFIPCRQKNGTDSPERLLLQSDGALSMKAHSFFTPRCKDIPDRSRSGHVMSEIAKSQIRFSAQGAVQRQVRSLEWGSHEQLSPVHLCHHRLFGPPKCSRVLHFAEVWNPLGGTLIYRRVHFK